MVHNVANYRQFEGHSDETCLSATLYAPLIPSRQNKVRNL